jgi:hypothetical protein
MNQINLINKEEMYNPEKIIDITQPAVENFDTPSKFYILSTSSPLQILLERDLDKNEWSSSTLKISSTTIDSTKFSFIFPNKKTILYQNCTYDIDLDLGENIKPNYIGVTLADAGTQKEVKSKDSGLIYSLTFKNNSFKWSVGNIWPGEYYLAIYVIDGQDVLIKSEKFFIEQKIYGDICE